MMAQNSNSEHAITTTISVDLNAILSIIVNAFDTAIGYWAKDADPHYPDGFDVGKIPWLKDPDSWKDVRKLYFAPLVPGGRLELHDFEDDEIVTMDLESVKRGVQVMSRDYPDHWADFISENDDAITADVFVQCCIFGDVKYG